MMKNVMTKTETSKDLANAKKKKNTQNNYNDQKL